MTTTTQTPTSPLAKPAPFAVGDIVKHSDYVLRPYRDRCLENGRPHKEWELKKALSDKIAERGTVTEVEHVEPARGNFTIHVQWGNSVSMCATHLIAHEKETSFVTAL